MEAFAIEMGEFQLFKSVNDKKMERKICVNLVFAKALADAYLTF